MKWVEAQNKVMGAIQVVEPHAGSYCASYGTNWWRVILHRIIPLSLLPESVLETTAIRTKLKKRHFEACPCNNPKLANSRSSLFALVLPCILAHESNFTAFFFWILIECEVRICFLNVAYWSTWEVSSMPIGAIRNILMEWFWVRWHWKLYASLRSLVRTVTCLQPVHALAFIKLVCNIEMERSDMTVDQH